MGLCGCNVTSSRVFRTGGQRNDPAAVEGVGIRLSTKPFKAWVWQTINAQIVVTTRLVPRMMRQSVELAVFERSVPTAGIQHKNSLAAPAGALLDFYKQMAIGTHK